MAVSPQCLTASNWPTAMSYRRFVKMVTLITWFIYLIHSSFHFLCTCTHLVLLGYIFIQRPNKHKLPLLLHVIDQTVPLFFCFPFSLSLSFPVVSPLSLNTCCRSCISSWGSQSFVRPRCQLTKCEGQPSLRELREAFPTSWQLKLFYCIYSQWLQATLPGLAPIAFRHLFLCLIKESAGVCCYASSLCTHTAASLCFLCFKVQSHPFACLNMPVGGSFCAQLESRFR